MEKWYKYWSFLSFWNRIVTRFKEVNITIQEAWDLFLEQDRKCALTGLDIVFGPRDKGGNTASLDRIDSTKGYIKGNVQWVHKDINRMKFDLNQERFIELCKKVTEYAIAL